MTITRCSSQKLCRVATHLERLAVELDSSTPRSMPAPKPRRDDLILTADPILGQRWLDCGRAGQTSFGANGELVQNVDGFERGHRRLGAFVPGLGAGALDGLLDVFGGQYPERNGNPGI